MTIINEIIYWTWPLAIVLGIYYWSQKYGQDCTRNNDRNARKVSRRRAYRN